MIAALIAASARNVLLVLIGVVFAAAAGLYALFHMPLDAIPDLSDTQVIVYTEYLAANLPADRATTEVLRRETELAQRIVAQILPPLEFSALAAAIDDSTAWERGAQIVEQYLSTLESARIAVNDALALQFLPSGAFGGAYKASTVFVTSASEPLQKLSDAQRDLLRSYLQSRMNALRRIEELRRQFPRTLKS